MEIRCDMPYGESKFTNLKYLMFPGFFLQYILFDLPADQKSKL